MVKYFCDACGTEVHEGEVTGEFKFLAIEFKKHQPQQSIKSFLLCQKCKNELHKSYIELEKRNKDNETV